MLLRKDLKPGTVFQYVADIPNGYVSYVPPMSNPPKGAVKSGAKDSSHPSWYDEVVVIPPTEEIQQKVTSLPHYTGKQIEAIDVIEDWGLNFRLANVIKYVARHGKKAGADAKEDLKKARAYLSREIAALEGRHAWD